MCGRYQSSSPTGVLAERYAAEPAPGVEGVSPSWNVAPTDPVRVVRESEGVRRLEAARWGLVLGERSPGRPLINLRAETVLDRPAFRRAAASGRVVVPADGFYEWKAPEPDAGRRAGRRRAAPHHLRRADGDILAMAGLWVPDPAGRANATVAVITASAGPDVDGLHHRMPVILEEGDWQEWLHDAGDLARLSRLLTPSPGGTLTARPVSNAVNLATNDGPHLLDPPDRRPEGTAGGPAPGQLSLDGL